MARKPRIKSVGGCSLRGKSSSPGIPVDARFDRRMGADGLLVVLHEEISGAVIGAAMAVLNALRPGLDEKIYERSLVIELKL